MTRMGEQVIWSVSGRLPDNPGELAQMNSVIGRVRYSRSCLNHTFVCSFCRGCSQCLCIRVEIMCRGQEGRGLLP